MKKNMISADRGFENRQIPLKSKIVSRERHLP
jgi:hypothetical protein